MKKIIPVFLTIILAISLCACSGGGDKVKFTPNLSSPFTVNAVIEYDDTTSEAVFRKYGNANWDIEFSSPNTLAGVVLSYRDDNVEASYKGLSFSVPKSALPVKSIISAFIEVVDTLSQQTEIDAVEDEGLMEIEGELSQGKYTLKLDKNGGLAEFDMPNLDVDIDFTSFVSDPSVSEPTTEPVTETIAETDATTEAVTE